MVGWYLTCQICSVRWCTKSHRWREKGGRGYSRNRDNAWDYCSPQPEGQVQKMSHKTEALWRFWKFHVTVVLRINDDMSNCHLIVITWFQCVKKILWVPMGSQIHHLWPRWPSPNILACLNLNLTQWHPLVAKFSNICHFRHFLRVPRKT